LAAIVGPSLAKQLISAWLEEEFTYDLVAYSTIGELAAAEAVNKHPVLILLGLAWEDTRPGERVVEDVGMVCSLYDRVPVLAILSDLNPHFVRELLAHGVRGVIPTHTSGKLAAAAIRLVLAGGVYSPPELINPVPPRNGESHHLKGQASPEWTQATDLLVREHFKLSPREAEVLSLLRGGRTNLEIAASLGIAVNTTIVHVQHLMRKVGASNRTQAVYNVHLVATQMAQRQG
jgi:DNA-binding NarL/FixJ family response regulator